LSTDLSIVTEKVGDSLAITEFIALVAIRTDISVITKTKSRLIHTTGFGHAAIDRTRLPIITGNVITHTLGSHTGIQIGAGIAIITFDQKIPDGKMAPLHLRHGRITKGTDLPFAPHPILKADIPNQTGALYNGIKTPAQTITLVFCANPIVIAGVIHPNARSVNATNISVSAWFTVITRRSFFAYDGWKHCISVVHIFRENHRVTFNTVFHIRLFGDVCVRVCRISVVRDAVFGATSHKEEANSNENHPLIHFTSPFKTV